MVGFGSSLRMSRRRGWEDAYLDYQSLRLLLTQIEAVYEEEDWKRGENNNNGDDDVDVDDVMAEEEGAVNVAVDPAVSSEGTNDDVNNVIGIIGVGRLRRMCGDAWRATRAVATGKSYHRYTNSGTSRRRRYPRGSNNHRNHVAVNSNTTNTSINSNGGWVVSNDYFDYSNEQSHGHHRSKRKKDIKDGTNSISRHDRALDRGGWRSPGVTDYRDELFTVSDEERAYGYYEEEEEDDSEWEDEEDDEGNDNDNEGIGLDNGDHGQYYDTDNNNGVEYYDDGRGREVKLNARLDSDGQEEYLLADDSEEEQQRQGQGQQYSDLKISTGFEEPEMEDKMNMTTSSSLFDDHQDNMYRDSCNSPVSALDQDRIRENGSSVSKNDNISIGLLQTPDSQNSSKNIAAENKPGQKVKFSNSPGVLEAGYETFAAAAAKTGFMSPYSNNDGQNSMTMTVGSPSEQQKGGWLDFIPNILLLSRGKQQQQLKAQNSSSSDIDPLLFNNQRESLEDDFPLNDNGSSSDHSPLTNKYGQNVNNVVADDSPHRYTHFSERFLRSRSSDLSAGDRRCPPPPPILEEEEEGSFSQLASALNNAAEERHNEEDDENNVEAELKPPYFGYPMTPIDTPPLWKKTQQQSIRQSTFPAVKPTAVGKMLSKTPMTPPMTPKRPTRIENDNRKGGFGVSLKMIPTESSELLHHPSNSSTSWSNSPTRRKTPGGGGHHQKKTHHADYYGGSSSQFYSFQNEEEDDYYNRSSSTASTNLNDGQRNGGFSSYQTNRSIGQSSFGEHTEGGGDEEGEEQDCNLRVSSNTNMISFYSRSPLKIMGGGGHGGHHHHPPRQHDQRDAWLQSLSPVKHSMSEDTSGGNFILSFLFGNAKNDESEGNMSSAMPNHQGPPSTRNHRTRIVTTRSSSNNNDRSNSNNQSWATAKQKQRAAEVAAKRKRAAARLRKQRQRRRKLRRSRNRNRERIPEHLRIAHLRAAAITERFRGLLRAEVEKVILFANSRLGELSDTIGSLRYASYEDGEAYKKYPSLADGGMHDASSSEDGDSDDGAISCASSLSDVGHPPNQRLDHRDQDHRIFKSDSSKDATKKQIMLRDRLRISSPMFQKADFLGEDFSLLSAVDEADAYTAVGVELMHLLKYVCVNIIAVRKICKKHDRLLSNRMLGGYYQRLAMEAKKSHGSKRSSGRHQQHLFQLNDHQAQPRFWGTLSTGYTLGIWDARIQHIANSTTMQTVSSSLAIALADFEASQSRSALLGLGFGSKSESTLEKVDFARHEVEVPSPRHQTFTTSRLRDAVTYQISGQCFRGDEESTDVASQEGGCGEENASTSSNMSLTRLQFVVASIFGLREAARLKSLPFEHYSSRLFMISTGPNVAGDGLDGCSRETLDFLCSYNPDAAYTLDMESLYTSLKLVGRGKDDGIGDVMVASLAAAAKGYELASDRSRFRRHVATAMSINPQATGEEGVPSFRNVEYQNILRLNAISMILYFANYYIIVPTAHIHSTFLGSRGSTAVLIGTANISSLLSSFIHTILMSKRSSFIRKRAEPADFRIPLILCSAFAATGNILYSYSLMTNGSSLGMALVGRFLVGLGSAEILNRQLLTTILPQESVNTEAASLAKMSMITLAVALVIGSVVDIKVNDSTEFVFNRDTIPPLLASIMLSSDMPSPAPADEITLLTIPTVQPFLPPLPSDPYAPSTPFGQRSLFSLESTSLVMAVAWMFHLIGLIFFFDLPTKKRVGGRGYVHPDELKLHTTHEEDFDSDTETYEKEQNPPYSSAETNPFVSTQETSHDGTFEKLQTMSRKTVKHHSQHSYRESISNIRRLMFSNVAFPTTVAILFVSKTTAEVLISSCGTICSRYFDWSGARSGLFMGLMASMILPVNMSLASEQNFTERSITKVALEIARYGLMLMVNYESMFVFIVDIFNGDSKRGSSTAYHYDGIFGTPQYLLSFAVVFSSIVTLEAVTLMLMSKVQVAPRHMKKYSIDNAFVVVFISAFGRLVGDTLIVAFDISSWAFFSDIVNSLCITLIIALTAGIYVVRKHFFFLI